MKKNYNDTIKVLAVPVSILAIIILLIIVSLNIIFTKVSGLNKQISDNKKTEDMLQQKLSSLQSIAPEITNDSQSTVNALPGSNSGLQAISQVQAFSFQSGLVVNNLSSQTPITPPTAQLNSVSIDFSVDGSYANLTNFVARLNNSAPLMSFVTIRVKNQNTLGGGANIYRLSASTVSYWSPLPVSLPSIDQPIVQLTPDEETTLTKITSLESLTSTIPDSSPSGSTSVGRENPFQ